ncbi:hypothetical protein M0R45_010146 [Rubus argutus]|uniref:Uncharacterized protein n=1 Tax=Rubus argutus TaxID=59490 RepID=A0AAW1Y690_RUBAR
MTTGMLSMLCALKLRVGVEEVAGAEEPKVVVTRDHRLLCHHLIHIAVAKAKRSRVLEGKQQDPLCIARFEPFRRYLATEEQSEKAIVETAVKYHPDKQGLLFCSLRKVKPPNKQRRTR